MHYTVRSGNEGPPPVCVSDFQGSHVGDRIGKKASF